MEIPPYVLQEWANYDVQQPYGRILCRGRYNALFGESVAGLDTKAFRVVVSSISWCINERRVSGVAVTRHSVFVVATSLVDAVDEDGERHPPGEFVLDHAAPAAAEFVSDRLTPFDDRHDEPSVQSANRS